MLDHGHIRSKRRLGNVNGLHAIEESLKALLAVVLMIVIVVFYLMVRRAVLNAPLSPPPPSTPSVAVEAIFYDATRIESTDCNDNMDCTKDFLFVEADFCEHIFQPNGTNCSNVCYIDDATTTTCGATGTCSGEWTECRGYCTSDDDCLEAIPFDPLWLTAAGEAYYHEDEQIVYSNRSICEMNRCVLIIMDIFINPNVDLGNDFAQPIGAATLCQGYLDPTFVQERASCLNIERRLLAVNVTNVTYFLPDEADSTPQFSICTYYYQCSGLNQTAVALASIPE